MNQDSNTNAYTPWGEPGARQHPASSLMTFLTTPALVSHIVVMLCVCSGLMLVNLIAAPRVWWSIAVLAIWLAVVIIHGIGLASRSLLAEDEDAPAPASSAVPPGQPSTAPTGPPMPAWLSMPSWDRSSSPSIPQSWELNEDAVDTSATTRTSWPEQATGSQRAAPEHPPPQRVSWRAATDIAWLRRPSRKSAETTARNEDGTEQDVSS